MFGLGAGEILVICIFGLIFVGPKKIPDLARSLGRGLRAFQRARDEMVDELHGPSENKGKDKSNDEDQ